MTVDVLTVVNQNVSLEKFDIDDLNIIKQFHPNILVDPFDYYLIEDHSELFNYILNRIQYSPKVNKEKAMNTLRMFYPKRFNYQYLLKNLQS